MPTPTLPSIERVREHFPSLAGGVAFMDNAGGSQLPRSVAEAMFGYMTTTYVQLGAGYPTSVAASRIVADAHDFVETLMGASDAGKAILGSSSSALLRMLSDVYADTLKPLDEVIVAESGHEANVSPWISLGKRGATIRMWEADPDSGVCTVESLAQLLTDRTRIVAFPHVSNLLGGVEDVQLCVKLAQRAGARVVVDGVAFAPHLAMKVAEWGVDWYSFSCYKVFGPHMAALYGSSDALRDVVGQNHPFFANDDIPYKFELGGVNHESCAGLLGIVPYLNFLAGRESDAHFDRSAVEEAFAAIQALETPLAARLLQYLRSNPKIRIVGPATNASRVATISFVHRDVDSGAISAHLDGSGIGMRNGHMYSLRLLERLGIPPTPGVARISLSHYNAIEEVDRLIKLLEQIL